MRFFPAMKTSTQAISLFAVVCAAVIAVTQVSTKGKIERNEREQRAKALYEIVPRSGIENDLLEDTLDVIAPELQGNELPVTLYLARKNGQVKTVIMPLVAPDGYSGKIHMIAGINADGTVAGVRVLAHKETPGLGDKVDTKKSDWILSFNGLSKQSKDDARWAVRKDGGEFDQFTGATITPRAVVNAVSRGVDYFTANRTMLLQQKSEQTAEVKQ